MIGTIVPEQIQHKLNYFLFCQFFENLFSICVKFSITSKVLLSSLHADLQVLRLLLRQSRHTRLFHNPLRLFNILHNHYLSKFSELKNQVLKLRFKIKLIIQQFVAENSLSSMILCCWWRLGNMSHQKFWLTL